MLSLFIVLTQVNYRYFFTDISKNIQKVRPPDSISKPFGPFKHLYIGTQISFQIPFFLRL